jgi:hypothetical protein
MGLRRSQVRIQSAEMVSPASLSGSSWSSFSARDRLAVLCGENRPLFDRLVTFRTRSSIWSGSCWTEDPARDGGQSPGCPCRLNERMCKWGSDLKHGNVTDEASPRSLSPGLWSGRGPVVRARPGQRQACSKRLTSFIRDPTASANSRSANNTKVGGVRGAAATRCPCNQAPATPRW